MPAEELALADEKGRVLIDTRMFQLMESVSVETDVASGEIVDRIELGQVQRIDEGLKHLLDRREA